MHLKTIKLYLHGHMPEVVLTFAAIGTLALLLHAAANREFLYESALRGGALSARASESDNIFTSIKSPSQP